MIKIREEKVKLTSKGIILDIISMRSYARKFLGKGKEYEQLLSYILKENYYNDMDLEMPNAKSLSSILSISYGKTKRLLESIYNDILFNEENQHEIKEVEFWFLLYNYESGDGKKHNYKFFIKSFPVIPRVGEQFEIPFFKEYLKTENFFVENITYEFNDEKVTIFVELRGGFYNKYWHIRKDEAIAKEELTISDLFNLNDQKLMEKLGVIKPFNFNLFSNPR